MKLTTPNEGKLTVKMERKSQKIPSGVYLSASLTALIASLILKKRGKNVTSFLIQWTVPILIIGLYSKIAKTARWKWNLEKEDRI